jgi:hypothetical protein
MPEKKTLERAKRDLKQGKSASTAAGEFVREEMEHIRLGKHGARSSEQAIAIGLSKARRAGVPLSAPKAGKTSARTQRSAERDLEVGQGRSKRRPSTKRRRASTNALKREPRAAASKAALSRHAKAAAPRRTKATASSRTSKGKSSRSGATNGRGRRAGSRSRPKATAARSSRSSSAAA